MKGNKYGPKSIVLKADPLGIHKNNTNSPVSPIKTVQKTENNKLKPYSIKNNPNNKTYSKTNPSPTQ
jgi:hypothetical protein